YDCSSLGTTSRNDRYISALTLVDDQGIEGMIEGIQSSDVPHAIYYDLTEQSYVTSPGATITITPEGAGSWMHTYAYIDWAGDGFSYTTPGDYLDIDTDAEVAEQYKLRPGVDLVAFTRWCPTSNEAHWYNTDGYVGQNNNNNIHNWDITNPFSFTIPADAKPGTYRMRVKSAWNQLDPNGVPDIQLSNTLVSDGGCIVDFTLVIEGETEVQTTLVYNSFIEEFKWSVTEFCCEEDQGEGSNGRATQVADNDEGTYWHTNWRKAQYQKGAHFFVLDLKKSRDVYGIAYTPRQGTTLKNGLWRTVNVFASDDESAFKFTEKVADYTISLDKHQELSDLLAAYVAEHEAEGRTCTFTAAAGAPAESAMFEEPLSGRYLLVVVAETETGHSVCGEFGLYLEDNDELQNELEKPVDYTPYIDQLTIYKGNLPGATEIVNAAVDKIQALPGTDLETNANAIISETRNQLNAILAGLATSGKNIVIKHANRAKAGLPAVLSYDEAANAWVTVADEASTWAVQEKGTGSDFMLFHNESQKYPDPSAGLGQDMGAIADKDAAIKNNASIMFELSFDGYVGIRCYGANKMNAYVLDDNDGNLQVGNRFDTKGNFIIEYAIDKESFYEPYIKQIAIYEGHVFGEVDIIQEAIAKIRQLAVDDDLAVNAKAIITDAKNQLKAKFQDVAAEGRSIVLKHVNRANAGKPAYLAYVDETWNTIEDPAESTWTLQPVEGTSNEFLLLHNESQKYPDTYTEEIEGNAGVGHIGVTDDKTTAIQHNASVQFDLESDGYVEIRCRSTGKLRNYTFVSVDGGTLYCGMRASGGGEGHWIVEYAPEKPVKPEPVAVDMTVTPAGGKVDALSSISFYIADA
ncbi:MAG: discoidin domain-containing protein, partial [Muribaculaceae bacterium]|nr:discoidin domain-containing protein [Muribaculaceae bacterium]